MTSTYSVSWEPTLSLRFVEKEQRGKVLQQLFRSMRGPKPQEKWKDVPFTKDAA